MKLPCIVQIFVCLSLQHLGSPGKLFLLNRSITESLDLPDPIQLPSRCKSKGTSCLSGTACSSDPVDIIFNILRDIIIDNHLYILHINTSSRHIGGNQNIGTSVSESSHSHITLMLGHISMKPFRPEPGFLQHLRQLVHLYLGVAEYQAKPRLIIFQQTDAGGFLILISYLIISLGHQRNRKLLGRYLYQSRILLKLTRNLQYGLRHGS